MKLNVPMFVLNAGVAAVLGTLANNVTAAEPLSLTLAQSFSHDTNFSRTTTPQSETISQTDAILALDKPYGRQNYSGSARIGAARFEKNGDKLNSQNYDVSAGFSSEIASNWLVNLNASASENLNPNQNNPTGERVEKNVVSQRDGGLSIQYGVLGRWAMIGTASMSRLKYSLASQETLNREQGSQGLRLTYAPSDLLVFGLGGTHTQSDYKNLVISGAPEQITQNSIDLTANWQSTGSSRLNGRLSAVENSYRSRPDISLKTFTGRATWTYTPRGLMTYALTLARSTDSDPNRAGFIDSSGTLLDRSRDNVTTSAQGNVRWNFTQKVGFGAALGWYKYDIKDAYSGSTTSINTTDSSHYTTFTLSGDYQYSRAINMGCSAQSYKQTQDYTRVAFDGAYYSCRASFTID